MPDILPGVLKVTCDHAQTRIKRDPIGIALRGQELYDPSVSSDTILLPIINTIAVKPYQLMSGWFTSNSGAYTKPTIGSGYEVLTSGKWKEVENFPGAGKFLMCDDSAGEYARTDSAPGLNRGMYIAPHGYSGNDVVPFMECGWSNSATPSATTASIGLQFWTDGSAFLYKEGVLRTQGNIGCGDNKIVSIIILPCRRREILVFATNGQGFAYIFEEIEEGDPAPVITSASEKFFVTPSSASHLQVQFAPLTFPSTAYSESFPLSFGRAPDTGSVLYAGWTNPTFTGIHNAAIYGDKAFAGASDVTAVDLLTEAGAAFVPDGVTTAARIKITYSSDGSYCPFIYGSMVEYDLVTALTNSTQEFDLSPYFLEASLSVPDDPYGTSMDLVFMLGLEIETDGVESVLDLRDLVPNILTQSFRPIRAALGTKAFHDAYVEGRPKFTDGIRAQVMEVSFKARAIEGLLETYQFRGRVPFDGWSLTEAIKYVLRRCGIPESQMFVSEFGFTIPEIPDRDCSQWNCAAEENENGREVMDKLMRYASDAFVGGHPGLYGPEFWVLAPEDMPTTPLLVLYRSEVDAHAAYPDLPMDSAALLQYDNWDEETLAIEANEVWATGVEPRTGRSIQSYAIDEESADPEIAPDARPSNWIGLPLVAGLLSSTLRSTTDTDKAVESLIPVATEQQQVGEFDANTFLVYSIDIGTEDEPNIFYMPLWRGDLITLDGIGQRRISSLTAHFLKEVEEGERGAGFVRTAHYTTGAILGNGGTTLATIQGNQQARMAKRVIDDRAKPDVFFGGVLKSQRFTA